MDRRHYVALSLGLVLCLVLLGRWALSPDERNDAALDQPAAIPPTPDESLATAPDVSAEAASADTFDTGANNDAADSGVFRGRLLDAVTRQPVREFQLVFHPARRTRDSREPPLQNFTTKDGRFVARDLPAGLWTMFATAGGYQRFELPDVTIVSGKASPEILIPMRPGYSLHGRVFEESSGDGIASATIHFREAHIGRYEGNFRARPSTTSRKDGTFVLEGLPAGPVVLTVYAPNYGGRDFDVMVGNKMAPVEIGLSTGGSLVGYLAGADGLTPVAGMISLNHLDESSSASMPTGPAGEFAFTQLGPGRYRLSGRAAGLSGNREIALSNNERLEGIVLPMHGGYNIRGVVSGLRPEQLKSTVVTAYRDGDVSLSVESPVDARGGYTLQNVAPGSVRVIALAGSSRQIIKVVEMPGSSDLTVNLEFQQGARLTGRVTRAGKPLGDVSLSPRAVETAPGKQELYIHDVRSSATGEYAIDDLPHGEYTLWVESFRSPAVRVSGDTVFDIEIPAVQLAGRLLEHGGTLPVVGANVDIWSAQPGAARIRLSARSDHFGQFSVRGLQPGDFVVSVYKPGYELYRGPLAYGSPISNLTINLRPARGVELKVRDAAGGKAANNVTATEIIDGQVGIVMQMNLDQNGVGYLPSGIAGSSLKFVALGYIPVQITAWNGEGLEVSLQRQPVR